MNFVNNNARLTCNIITTMYIKTDPVRKRPFDIIMDHYITLGFTITTLPMPHLPRWLVEFFRNIIAFFMFDISELISSPECEWEFSTVGIFMGKMTIPVWLALRKIKTCLLPLQFYDEKNVVEAVTSGKVWHKTFLPHKGPICLYMTTVIEN